VVVCGGCVRRCVLRCSLPQRTHCLLLLSPSTELRGLPQVVISTQFLLAACNLHVDLYKALEGIFNGSPFSLWITPHTATSAAVRV
jgi:hypothetical protein